MKNLITFLCLGFILTACQNNHKQDVKTEESETKKEQLSNPNTNVNFNSCFETDKIINHDYYSLSYNEEAEQAEWVSYKLTTSSFSQNIERTNDFREDPMVIEGSANLGDYYKSGYDRGHLAPAGSMKKSELSMSESFMMSNMSPQLAGFNRGVWKRLEGKVRFWVENNDSILVVTGPILDNPLTTIGENEVFVPRAFFKVLVAYKNEKVMGIGFIVPHEKSDKSLYSFATSIDSIEDLTGIDFYCRLDELTQSIVEKNSSVKNFIYR